MTRPSPIQPAPLNVLLIEDNPGDVRLIQEMLAEEKGRRTIMEHADRLSSGLDRLARGGIDIILLDLGLPDSQGLESLERIQPDIASIPVIVLTSVGNKDLVPQALQQGAQDYLLKGQFSVELLLRSMLYAIERKRTEAKLVEKARFQMLAGEVGVALTQSDITLQKSLQKCAEAMVQHLDAALARIWTFNEGQNVLELEASAGLYTHLEGTHSRVQVGQDKIGLIAQERKPHVINAVIGDPRVHDQEWAKREGIVAFAGHPLIFKNRLLGVVGVFFRHPVTEAALQVLASVADGIALGIERVWAEEALKKTKTALGRSQEELRTLTGQLLTAQEEERRRISRDLHDDVNQRLAVLALKIQTAQKGLAETDPSLKTLQDLYDGVAELSDDVRHLAYQLHPSVLDDLGLRLALQALTDDFSQWEGIAVSFTAHQVPVALPQEIATCFYRLTQEAIRNVAKHAQASEVEVALDLSDDGLRLSVKDNGVGFDPQAESVPNGLGLLSMKERLRLLQGTLTIMSEPGKGTVITAWLPLLPEAL